MSWLGNFPLLLLAHNPEQQGKATDMLKSKIILKFYMIVLKAYTYRKNNLILKVGFLLENFAVM